MPKNGKTATRAVETEAFGKRLVALLEANGQARHGAGRYLADRYKVSAVTANAWLNGTHKADTGIVRRIAEDHGTTFEELYFGRPAADVASPITLTLTPAEYDLVAKYRATDDSGRVMIDNLVDVVLSQERPR